MMKRPSFALAALAAVTLPSLAQASEGGLPQLNPEWFASQIFWLAVHFAVLYVVATTLILPRIAQALDRRDTKVSGDLETADKLGKEASALKTAHEASLSSARTEAQAARAATVAATLADQVAAEKKLGEELARQALAAQERINQASAAMRARMRDVAAEATMDIVTRLSGVAVDRSAVDAALGRLLDSQLKEVA
jgi:F-type H+-transporting ATPase subunit b